MSMWRSPHRKTRVAKQNRDLWLPMGKKGGKSFKPSGGAQPGLKFKDPQGKLHTTPDKRRVKKPPK